MITIYFSHETRVCLSIILFVNYLIINSTLVLPNGQLYYVKRPKRYKKNKKHYLQINFQSFDQNICMEKVIQYNTHNMKYSELVEYFGGFFNIETISCITFQQYDPIWIEYDTQYDYKTKTIKFDTFDKVIHLQKDNDYIELYQPDCVMDDFNKLINQTNRHKFTKTIIINHKLSFYQIKPFDFPQLETMIIDTQNISELHTYTSLTSLTLFQPQDYSNRTQDCITSLTNLLHLKIIGPNFNYSKIADIIDHVRDHPNLQTFIFKMGWCRSGDLFYDNLIKLIDINRVLKKIKFHARGNNYIIVNDVLAKAIINNPILEYFDIYNEKSVNFISVQLSIEMIDLLIKRGVYINANIRIKEYYSMFDSTPVINDILKNGYNNSIALSLLKWRNDQYAITYIKNYKIYNKSLFERTKRNIKIKN